MTTSTHRVLALLAALPLALGALAMEGDAEPIEATEKLYISAGCPTDATGTCTSTRWLGKTTGDATSNFTYAITPVDEVFYQTEGSINWRDYPSDLSLLDEGYLLDVDRDATMSISFEGDGVSATSQVHGKLDLRHCASGIDEATGETVLTDCRTTTVEAPPQTLTGVVGPAGPTVVDFTFDLGDDLAGRTLQRMTAWVALHGANAYWGFINQQGGSTVTIPHLVAVETGSAS